MGNRHMKYICGTQIEMYTYNIYITINVIQLQTILQSSRQMMKLFISVGICVVIAIIVVQ